MRWLSRSTIRVRSLDKLFWLLRRLFCPLGRVTSVFTVLEGALGCAVVGGFLVLSLLLTFLAARMYTR